MATILDIVNRAFRLIGVKAEDEALTSDQIATGVDTLNMLMNAWPKRGIDIPTGYALTSTNVFPMEPWAEEPTTYCLAARLAPQYSQPAPDVREHEQTLRNWFVSRDPIVFPRTLTRMPSRRMTGYAAD